MEAILHVIRTRRSKQKQYTIEDIIDLVLRFYFLLLGAKVNRFHQYLFSHEGQQLIILSTPPI